MRGLGSLLAGLTFAAGALWSGPASESHPEARILELGGKVTRDHANRITGLDLSYTWISDGDLEPVGQLKDLRSLDLSFVRVTDRGIERLRSLPAVERLILHSAEHITDFSLTYLRSWKNLRTLDLGGTDITDIGLEFLSSFEQLESLDISMTQATDNGIEFLTALRRLRELKLGGNVMTAGSLLALRVLPNLVSLDLSGVQRRNSGAWQVSITDLDLELFSTFDRLEKLNLRGRKITDLGTLHLARMKNLRSLNLSETAVTNEGLKNISQLSRMRQLQLAGLTGVDDKAIPLLLEMKQLEQVDLSGTSVSDAGLKEIAAAGNLRKLFVGGSKVSKAGVDSLAKERPEIQVSWWQAPAPVPMQTPGSKPARAKLEAQAQRNGQQ